MTYETNDTTIIREDIASIKEQIIGLTKNFDKFTDKQDKFCETISTKVDKVENKGIATETKVNNLAIFQAGLSIISSAIAGYLGLK